MRSGCRSHSSMRHAARSLAKLQRPSMQRMSGLNAGSGQQAGASQTTMLSHRQSSREQHPCCRGRTRSNSTPCLQDLLQQHEDLARRALQQHRAAQRAGAAPEQHERACGHLHALRCLTPWCAPPLRNLPTAQTTACCPVNPPSRQLPAAARQLLPPHRPPLGCLAADSAGCGICCCWDVKMAGATVLVAWAAGGRAGAAPAAASRHAVEGGARRRRVGVLHGELAAGRNALRAGRLHRCSHLSRRIQHFSHRTQACSSIHASTSHTVVVGRLSMPARSMNGQVTAQASTSQVIPKHQLGSRVLAVGVQAPAPHWQILPHSSK